MMYLVSGENKIKMSNFPEKEHTLTATVGLIGLIVLFQFGQICLIKTNKS